MQRGEIWWASLPDPVGAMPGYRRPLVIVQADSFNRSRINTVLEAKALEQRTIQGLLEGFFVFWRCLRSNDWSKASICGQIIDARVSNWRYISCVHELLPSCATSSAVFSHKRPEGQGRKQGERRTKALGSAHAVS